MVLSEKACPGHVIYPQGAIYDTEFKAYFCQRAVQAEKAYCSRCDGARYFKEGITGSRLSRRHFVSQNDSKPARTWREIVEELSREEDTEKVRKLAEELERALGERREKLHAESKIDPDN
jgi:hypothetical protein